MSLTRHSVHRLICFTFFAAAAFVASGSALAADEAPAGPPPALVRVGSVHTQNVQQRSDVLGRLREVRRATVAAEMSGRVVAIEAEEGQRVVGGKTVLAKTDDLWAQIALQRAEAAYAEMTALVAEEEARLDRAASDLKYLRQLQEQNSARPKEVEDAASAVRESEAKVSKARAQKQSADADLRRAKEEVERLTVVAPFDGVVVRKMTEVGQWLATGNPVAEVISSGEIEAVVDVPESLVNHLKANEAIEVIIEPLRMEVMGKVVAIVPDANAAARTFPVKIRLDDKQGQLKPGMSVIARAPTGTSADRLTVPRDAIMRTPNGAVVWANIGGQAMSIGVKVLFGVGDRYAIDVLGGGPPLTDGMQVVVEGAERLFPTRPLMIADAGSKK